MQINQKFEHQENIKTSEKYQTILLHAYPWQTNTGIEH